MTNTTRNALVASQVENQKKSGLLDELKKSKFLKEAVLIKAMKLANIQYHGAIDTQDQDKLFEFYGILFQPSRNHGADMWEATNFVNNN